MLINTGTEKVTINGLILQMNPTDIFSRQKRRLVTHDFMRTTGNLAIITLSAFL